MISQNIVGRGHFFDLLFMSPQQFELWKFHLLEQKALVDGLSSSVGEIIKKMQVLNSAK